MKRFLHGKKVSKGREKALNLWFLDERERAKQLDPAGGWWFFCYRGGEQKAWGELREQILGEWIAKHPGTRPRAFWVYDAPRSASDPDEPEQRRQVGGAGRPACAGSGFGLPLGWEDFDASNPPVFESEASYLERHGLLSAEEKRRADFSPVVVRNERDLTYHYGRFECAF
jgi:hypothetical protein